MTQFTGGKKPFFVNILDDGDVEAHPELLDFVLSPEVAEAVTDYFGYNPASQMHGDLRLDGQRDDRVEPVVPCRQRRLQTTEVLYQSRRNRSRTGSVHVSSGANNASCPSETQTPPGGSEDFRDEDVGSVTDLSDAIVLTGSVGSGAFVDTSRCLHYGSRARRGYRLVLMFNYMPFPDLKMNKGMFDMPGMPLFRIPSSRFKDDPLRRTLLGREN